MTDFMHAISIRQPWAGLIILGIKDIENRTWQLPERFIGVKVGIHAGVQADRAAQEYAREPLVDAAERLARHCGFNMDEFERLVKKYPAAFNRGGIVGTGIFGESSLLSSSSPWAFQEPRTWHWPVETASVSDYTPCKGQLSFFKPQAPEITQAEPTKTSHPSLLNYC